MEGTFRQKLQAGGYEAAEKAGLLEPYKDAWGVNFRRSATAWADNWSPIYGD